MLVSAFLIFLLKLSEEKSIFDLISSDFNSKSIFLAYSSNNSFTLIMQTCLGDIHVGNNHAKCSIIIPINLSKLPEIAL